MQMQDPIPIPSEIHFIWLGSPLPEKYLRTLLQLLPIARRSGFKLNLWVDQPSNYYRSVDRYMSNLDLSTQNSFLLIKNLSELKAEMCRNDFFSQKNDWDLISENRKSGAFTRGQDRLNDFWSCVDREMIGEKNFAAASDLLRYAILYLKGGYYFDTDTQFMFAKDSKLIAERLSLGFKSNITCKFYIINPDDKNHLEKKIKLVEVDGYNDIIVASPQHPFMKKILEKAIQLYNKNDIKISNNSTNTTLMDAKRYRGSQRNPSYRTVLTIQMSGQELFFDTIKESLQESKLFLTQSALEPMCALYCKRGSLVSFAHMDIDVSSSDMTWVNECRAEKCYDDSAVRKLSQHRFFARQVNSITSPADENHPEKITNSIRR